MHLFLLVLSLLAVAPQCFGADSREVSRSKHAVFNLRKFWNTLTQTVRSCLGGRGSGAALYKRISVSSETSLYNGVTLGNQADLACRMRGSRRTRKTGGSGCNVQQCEKAVNAVFNALTSRG